MEERREKHYTVPLGLRKGEGTLAHSTSWILLGIVRIHWQPRKFHRSFQGLFQMLLRERFSGRQSFLLMSEIKCGLKTFWYTMEELPWLHSRTQLILWTSKTVMGKNNLGISPRVLRRFKKNRNKMPWKKIQSPDYKGFWETFGMKNI